MDKEKKQQIFLIVLIPIFLIALVLRLRQGSEAVSSCADIVVESDPAVDTMPHPQSDFSSKFIPCEESPFKNLLMRYIESKKKTESTKAEEPPLPFLGIQGIIWNTDTPQAIINNQVVKIGDRIEGVEIIDIDKQGIKVDYNDEIISIKR
jgi:hypothetical protein